MGPAQGRGNITNKEPPVSAQHSLRKTGGFLIRLPGKEEQALKMVVVNAPKALSGLLKKLFRIK